MTRPLDPDRLGAKGENKFAELCLDAGLNPARTDRDRVGWDFVVTWPLQPGPLDLRPAPVACHVQVKTVWAGNGSVGLNLGTLDYIVKDLRPAFVVVLEVSDPALEFVAAHLIHIEGDFLSEVLKRLRRAELDGRKASEVEFEPTVAKWGSRLPQVTGSAFRHAAEKITASGMAEYARVKEGQLRGLGYENGRFHLQTRFEFGSREEMIDGFLGLKPMRLVEAKQFDVRFGLNLQLGSLDTTNAAMELMPAAVDACVVTVAREGSDDGAIQFKGDLFLVPPQVSGPGTTILEARTGLLRVRVVITEKLSGGDVKLGIRAEPDIHTRRRPASAWRDLYQFLTWSNTEPVKIEVRGKRRLTTPISVVSPPRGDAAAIADLRGMIEAAGAVDWAMTRAQSRSFPLAASEVLDAAPDLDILRAMELCPDEVTPLTLTTTVPPGMPADAEIDMLYLNRVPVGEKHLAYAVKARMRASVKAQEAVWTSFVLQLVQVGRIDADDRKFRRFAADAVRLTGIKAILAPSDTGAADAAVVQRVSGGSR